MDGTAVSLRNNPEHNAGLQKEVHKWHIRLTSFVGKENHEGWSHNTWFAPYVQVMCFMFGTTGRFATTRNPQITAQAPYCSVREM
jgi:hypothetical protein